MATELVRRGYLRQAPAALLAHAFADGAGGCDPVLATTLVRAGVDVNTRLHVSRSGFDGTEGGETALFKAAEQYTGCAPGYPQSSVEQRMMIRSLVGLGANPNIANAEGKTVMFGLESPELLDLLLASGARANVRDGKGRSPAFASWTDEIVLRLLEAGADWRGKDDEGKTLRQIAVMRDMPGTLAWLDAHHGP